MNKTIYLLIIIFFATPPIQLVAQPTLTEVWATARSKLTTFVAEGELATWSSDKVGERFSAEATFHVERQGDRFFADIKLESLSGAGDLAGLIPQRTTIVCDGSTIHTCLFIKNHSKGAMIRIYPADSKGYLAATCFVWFPIHDVVGEFFSGERLLEVYGNVPVTEVPRQINLPEKHGISSMIVLDQQFFMQFAKAKTLARDGTVVEAKARFLFSNPTVPKFKKQTWLEDNQKTKERSIAFTRFDLSLPNADFSLTRLEGPSDAQVIDDRPKPSSDRGNREYVPFTPKTPN